MMSDPVVRPFRSVTSHDADRLLAREEAGRAFWKSLNDEGRTTAVRAVRQELARLLVSVEVWLPASITGQHPLEITIAISPGTRTAAQRDAAKEAFAIEEALADLVDPMPVMNDLERLAGGS